MTHDEKIVEAVARAIADADDEDYMEDFRRFDKRARAAITAYQAEAWQPIETAPKDGDELLVTNASLHGGFPQVVYWEDGRWHVPDAGISYHPDAFTHWRRDILPPAPKATP